MRDQMAYRIATDVAAQISPPPPPGTPPQFVLAAVLAERHRRELRQAPAGGPATAAPVAPESAAGLSATHVPATGAPGPGLATPTCRPRRVHAAQLALGAHPGDRMSP